MVSFKFPFRSGRVSVKDSMAYNYRTFRQNPLGEIAGSLGDLGTLLPLLTAMTAAGIIDLTSTLVFSGLWNILTGCIFGVPIVVQPMKAIAAIAISRQLSLKETEGAGLSVAIALLLLSVTGLLAGLGKIIPIPLVKGIQVGAGLSLILNAGAQLTSVSWLHPWMDNYLWLIFAGCLLSLTSRTNRFPYALFIFALGIIFATTRIPAIKIPIPGFLLPHFYLLHFDDVKTGFLTAGVGQLPLTVLNSVIAVTHLSADLLPERPAPSITHLGVSVGVMNVIGCWFGAMPVCHGAGGLAGQHRFGARSGASVIFLGVIKMILGFSFGSSIAALLNKFPHVFLAVLLFAAGAELAKVAEDLNSTARDLWSMASTNETDNGEGPSSLRISKPRFTSEKERKERFMIMMFTAGGVVAKRNVAFGMIVGLACWSGYRLQDWNEKQQPFGKLGHSIKKVFRRAQSERQPLLSS